MDKTSTLTIVGLLILGVVFFVGLLLFSREKADVGNPIDTAPTGDWATLPSETGDGSAGVQVTPKTVITAKHAYQSGTHIVAGEVPLPTPCHLIEANGSASEDKKTVLLEIASSIKTDEMCAQVITPARFKVIVKAVQSAEITATLNGQAVTLNLIEAGPDEDLDNFELYIKA